MQRGFRRLMDSRLTTVDESERMSHREDAIEVAEQGVKALGLGPTVSAYLMATFGAARLDELGDDDLSVALRVVARLQAQAGPPQGFPLAPGSVIDGEVFWIRGKVSLGV